MNEKIVKKTGWTNVREFAKIRTNVFFEKESQEKVWEKASELFL